MPFKQIFCHLLLCSLMPSFIYTDPVLISSLYFLVLILIIWIGLLSVSFPSCNTSKHTSTILSLEKCFKQTHNWLWITACHIHFCFSVKVTWTASPVNSPIIISAVHISLPTTYGRFRFDKSGYAKASQLLIQCLLTKLQIINYWHFCRLLFFSTSLQVVCIYF